MPATDEPNMIDCPACGKSIPTETHGRRTVARHACKGQPEREVYDSVELTPAQLEKAEAQAEVSEPASKKKGSK